MRFLCIVFITSFFLVSCSTQFGKVLKNKDYAYKLKMADEYYAKKKYKFAEQLFVELFPVYKGTDKFEELYYKYAYCSFYQKNYESAENLFKGFLEVFPNSPKAEEVSYMHAYTFFLQSPKVELEQTNTAKAIGMMQTFINTHPGSAKIKEATQVIAEGRAKLQDKQFRSAHLYYKVGQYRAAGISFSNLLNDYPEAPQGDEYKLMVLKSYYNFARLSIAEKQLDRFQKVTLEYNDFVDRYPDSKLLKEAQNYNNLSLNNIKELQNEQTKTSAER